VKNRDLTPPQTWVSSVKVKGLLDWELCDGADADAPETEV